MSIKNYLSDPVPIPTLVWLRIGVGLLGGGDILGNGIYYHWYKNDFADFTFRYYGFEWVYPFPEPFFSLFFIVGFLAGIAVAVGYKFRWAAPTLAICFTYLFLLEKGHYLNHAYLFCWLSWLLILTPAWREFSIDVWQKPNQRSRLIPRWSIAIFPFVMGIVYFWGGIAKINADWLLHADPLHSWVSSRSNTFLIGPLLKFKTTAYFMAWGGFLLDLTIAFFLLHKRLRWWALAAAVFFHLCNHLIFNIGIFPYLSLIMTSLWFDPDWPQKFVVWLGGRFKFVQRWRTKYNDHFYGYRSSSPSLDKVDKPTDVETPIFTNSSVGVKDINYTGHNPFWGKTLFSKSNDSTQSVFSIYDRPVWSPALGLFLLLVTLVHFYLPIRHHLISGDVAWTEEGHRYSWRMMLRSKQGSGYFELRNPSTGSVQKVFPNRQLNNRRNRKLYTHPDMILQYGHYLADTYQDTSGVSPEVYAHIRVRLNSGKYYPYIDPTVDLTTIGWTWLKAKTWVLPEGETLED